LDDRIYQRAVKGLSQNGKLVTYVCSGTLADTSPNLTIETLPLRTGMRRRLFSSIQAVYRGVHSGATILHLHDPELLPWAIILAKKRQKIVFDMHENYEARFEQWNINFLFSKIGRFLFNFGLRRMLRFIDGVVFVSETLSNY